MPIPITDQTLIDEKTGDITPQEHYDNRALAERKFKQVNKINLSKTTAVSQPYGQPLAKLQDIQELLLSLIDSIHNVKTELSSQLQENMDDIHEALKKAPLFANVEKTTDKNSEKDIEELLEKQKQDKQLKKCEEAIKLFEPGRKISIWRIAALAGLTHKRVKSLIEKGLLTLPSQERG